MKNIVKDAFLGICLGFPAVLLVATSAFAEERTVFLASDGDWASFLEAIPAAIRYDEYDAPRFRPILSLSDHSPYTIEIETYIRGAKFVQRAEGPSDDVIPAVQDASEELTQKVYLPSLTESIELKYAEGLDLAQVSLRKVGEMGERPVRAGFRLDHPEGGEWLLTLRKARADVAKGVVKLRFEVRGWDLAAIHRFLAQYRCDRVVTAGTLPARVRKDIEAKYRVDASDSLAVPGRARPARAVVSTSYRSALIGAHVAGLDDIPHLVYRGKVEETAARLQRLGIGEATVLSDDDGGDGPAVADALRAHKELAHTTIAVVSWDAAEQDACRRHFLGDAVVANPGDLAFASHLPYPRASLTAPIYALWRRTGMVFVQGGDLEKYEQTKILGNVYFGVNGYQRGFQWQDVEGTRAQIRDGLASLSLGEEPYLTLLGGDANIPCTFFIRGAWSAEEFPKVHFDADAVIFADASIYANLDDDVAMEACVGRVLGNTDEVTTYFARLMFREEMDDAAKVQANRALLVFGPWAREKDTEDAKTFEEETIAELRRAGGYECTSFVGSTWGADFLAHIGGARLLFANDFGFHNAGWGWSSYAHEGYNGPEANYNTQTFTMEFDANYCVASSNGCATCDDKNRDNLHYGGTPVPLGLLFLRNGGLGYFGMANASLSEITTPLTSISEGMSLGEAIRKHMNDRLANPKQGGLFGPRENWLPEVPGYDTLHETHPLQFAMTKQDALLLFGDPQARMVLPPRAEPLDIARRTADTLIAGAARSEHGWNLTGDADAESGYGQAGAGAAIFLAHLHEATGEAKYLEAARKAADWIEHVTAADTDRVPGLFQGDSGKGLLYLELARVTGEKRYLELARALVRTFSPEWKYKENDQPYWFTDMYGGAAGHILFLLEMHRADPEGPALAEARRAGEFLRKWAHPEGEGGLTWAMQPWNAEGNFDYTGFAHGTAGIVFSLCELSRATGDGSYLEMAERGAKVIVERATPLGPGYQWFAKYTPEPSVVKFQWCHGPPGMLLMFLELYETTRKDMYRTWAERTALTAAKPAKYFRADMGLCHGAPGNGDIFLEAYRVLGDERYLAIAKDHAEFARAQGTVTRDGISWRFGDRSYMNGAAGVGHFFLRLAFPNRFRPALIAK